MTAVHTPTPIAYGLVPFTHLHVSMRALAFVLAITKKGGITPFDEERIAAQEAIRAALEHPVSEEYRNARDALVAQIAAMQAVVNAASILDHAWNSETEEADTTDAEMALWDAIEAYRAALQAKKVTP